MESGVAIKFRSYKKTCKERKNYTDNIIYTDLGLHERMVNMKGMHFIPYKGIAICVTFLLGIFYFLVVAAIGFYSIKI